MFNHLGLMKTGMYIRIQVKRGVFRWREKKIACSPLQLDPRDVWLAQSVGSFQSTLLLSKRRTCAYTHLACKTTPEWAMDRVGGGCRRGEVFGSTLSIRDISKSPSTKKSRHEVSLSICMERNTVFNSVQWIKQ